VRYGNANFLCYVLYVRALFDACLFNNAYSDVRTFRTISSAHKICASQHAGSVPYINQQSSQQFMPEALIKYLSDGKKQKQRAATDHALYLYVMIRII